MRRILVIGCSAAGKSTVARQIGESLGIDVIHLDKLLWKPGCNLAAEDEEREIVAEIIEKPSWVIDGNYSESLPMRLQRADTIVLIDFSRWTCLYRASKRLVHFHGRTRPDMGEGCPEQLNFAFFKWIWRYPYDERPKLIDLIRRHDANAGLIELHDQCEVDRFICSLKTTGHSLSTASSSSR